MSTWKLEDVTSLPGVRHAVVLSADGLVKDRSPSLPVDDADRLAAACSGLSSLGVGVAAEHSPEQPAVEQVMVQFGGGFLFVRAAGKGSALAVLTERQIDPGLIAQEMTVLVARIGESLATPARRSLSPGGGPG